MKKVFLFIWQLPQNILGLIIILLTQAIKVKNYWLVNKYAFGVCLGNFIIFGDYGGRAEIFESDIKHEQGHQKQSLYLGWLYLIIIGIPSFSGNILDRFFHKKWDFEKRIKWYYNQPWEKWADKLGDVRR